VINELKDRVAIVDIGSNTVRLVIYEREEDRREYRELDNIKIAARLRIYLNGQQFLNEKGIRVLIDSLQTFQAIVRHYNVAKVICVATATIRQARNQQEIMQQVQEETGFMIKMLSEYEEAYYGYLAVVSSMDINEGITIDMGGGSTEVTYFRDRQLVQYESLPFGSLSLKLQFVKGEVPTDQENEEIRKFVQSQFEHLQWINDKEIPIIAMGGSARSIAQLHQSLIHYPLSGIHQYEMSILNLQEIKETIEPLSWNELQKIDGISKDRADTILPAIEVFQAICDISRATKFILSRKGLREGLLYNEMNKTNEKCTSLVDIGIQEIVKDFHIDEHERKYMIENAKQLFKQIKHISDAGNLLDDDDLELVERGALIFDVGKYVNEESSSQHTFYLLTNRTILGLSHRERVQLALIASYKGKGNFRQYIEPFKDWFTKEEQKKISLIGALLKIAEGLNITKRNLVKDIEISPQKDTWVMNIKCNDDFKPEKYQMERQKKYIEKLLKISVIPQFYLY